MKGIETIRLCQSESSLWLRTGKCHSSDISSDWSFQCRNLFDKIRREDLFHFFQEHRPENNPIGIQCQSQCWLRCTPINRQQNQRFARDSLTGESKLNALRVDALLGRDDRIYRNTAVSTELEGTEAKLAHWKTWIGMFVKLTSLIERRSVSSFIPRRRAMIQIDRFWSKTSLALPKFCWNDCSVRNFCSRSSPTWHGIETEIGDECPSKVRSNEADWVLSLKSMPIDVTIQLPPDNRSIWSNPSTFIGGFYHAREQRQVVARQRRLRTALANWIDLISLSTIVLVMINSTCTLFGARRKGVRGKRYWICKPWPLVRFKQSYWRM